MENLQISQDKDNINSCVYCGHFDPNFDENDMMVHFYKDCPMVS